MVIAPPMKSRFKSSLEWPSLTCSGSAERRTAKWALGTHRLARSLILYLRSGRT